ncbi:hypothetical protein N7476_005072 [Penicillium atrosanguineum]|uniref:Uncharacterized protein n=1 Tax=Penicillium atrosanguineum TaxID=1132637 RepID=A0A9W9PZ74_9EURO|nr:hypothetical protein N7526_002012 [Penicillium atrosanguineum]KAJ5318652.1 hypothetical protein N7476_005072 [Penicillium atrosanguineum]
MPFFANDHMIRRRLIIFALAIIGLAFASLNAANACFAVILRDRATSALFAPGDQVADNTFADLMNQVLKSTVIASIGSAVIAVFGAMLAARLAWLRNHDCPWIFYGCCHLALSVFLLVMGAWIIFHVRGFKPFFERFSGDGNVPYYNMMFYGGVGQAAYGASVVLTVFVSGVAIFLCSL